ncbi:hypothetical protein N7462_008051 [Penicillium macrosclerotiorum]|uniref:uncharacterized protein n=1 Tax=Penicillium macrosclerotiorum TaxID=303699 RepID=UPI002548A25F|nr:uncharacterized protein N7462_008051 [Penicillium macrosclerotiorum]KAJ5679807.1 hypothetical protein N7462_008051 [Penicillium macrosclerotiorum]
MAPSHLRAAMSIRSMASPMTLMRPAITSSILSISQSQASRYASTTQSESAQESATSSQAPAPASHGLQPPTLLRNYAYKTMTGTVTSVGRMNRTVSVTHRHNVWDKHIRKYYPKETRYLVSDPNNSLREGDVIEFSSGAPKSRHVHHVVERIVTPFAVPLEDRPAVMSREERQQVREQRWAEKYVRKESRRLGEDINLESIAQSQGLVKEGETVSTADLIHRIHLGQERVGKLKALVQERIALQERQAAEAKAQNTEA